MAVGTSVLGYQLCEFANFPKDGSFAVDFSGANAPNRAERVGTALLCQRVNSPATLRVLGAWKLYGNGMVAGTSPVVTKFSINTEVWIVWFRAGLLWLVQTY